MSTASRFVLALGALAAIVGLPGRSGSQVQPGSSTPPIPRQIATARRVFVSNAGSETYGAETYDRLTRYDGGPNRLYADFYAALTDWGRFQVVDVPGQADIVYAVRFENPIVDKQDAHDFVYDPQIQLRIVDPATQIVLWSVTEHIAPALTRAGDNANFDRAVTRLVERLRALTEAAPDEVARVMQAASAPAGVDRARRARHAALGGLLASSLASILQINSVVRACTPDPCSSPPSGMKNFLLVDFAAFGAGALIGWLVPVSGN